MRLRHTLVMVVVGAGIGYGLTLRGTAANSPAAGAARPAARGTSSPEGIAPARSRAAGELWLGDFESAAELSRWQGRHAEAESSEEHATHGRRSAKVTFEQTEEPAFGLRGNLDRQARDWRKYDALVFDIYNPQSSQQRVLLQLKDAHNKKYKEDIHLSAESSQRISVKLSNLKRYLNLSTIDEVTLFRWKPGGRSVFFVDGVHLRPAAADRAEARPTGITPAAEWQARWASSLEKLPRNPEELPETMTPPVQMALARNEYESVQVVLIGGAQDARATVTVSPLTRDDGQAQLPGDVIEIRRVGYVKTREPYYPVAYVGKWPDPLPLGNEVNIDAGSVQPVWITVGAPEQQPAGRYRGTITVADGVGRKEELPLEVIVWNFTISRTSHLKTAFDFYPTRLKHAYQEFVEGGQVWEGRWGELKQLYYLDMLKHRISPIMGADPTKDSFWRDMRLYRSLGLTTFGVGAYGGSNGNNWPKESEKLRPVMSWYRRAGQALHANGIIDAAYVYTYDEPKPGESRVARIMSAIHGAHPNLRNLLVMHKAPDPAQHAEWLRDVDILCIRMASYDTEHAERFKQLGKEMWMYVSSPAHPFPALVIDYPALSHRVQPWMCWKYKAQGLLYWCVNFWKGDPWKNPANFTPDQNGNGSLYYPSAQGPVPSIRMEALRDGMEDYEYLYLLQGLVQRARAQGNTDPALLERADKLLAVDPALIESLRTYTDDPAVLIAQRRAIAETIEKLQAAPPTVSQPLPVPAAPAL